MMDFLFAGLLVSHLVVAENKPNKKDQTQATAQHTTALADMQSRNGSKVQGQVEFVESPQGLQVAYKISGLERKKKYGFHIHEKGDCSSPDAKSAGPHFMPISTTGGTSQDSPQKHAGDMPMLIADNSGLSEGMMNVSGITLKGKSSIIGRAVIIHDGPDNPNQPSARRIACGIIR